jgi:hypothetical protein
MLGLQPGILINNRFSLYAAKALIPLEAPEEFPHPFPYSFILVFNKGIREESTLQFSAIKGIREILNLINSVQLWVFSVQLFVTYPPLSIFLKLRVSESFLRILIAKEMTE